MNPNGERLRLFQGYGIELEYMLVDRTTLGVRSVADRLLSDPDGNPCGDRQDGELTWSNELTRHVIEVKTTDPAPSLSGLADLFQAGIRRLDREAQAIGVCLMPTAMHPWMVPERDTELWPHADHEIYAAYDRVFDCRRHGWANLQSMHINLPFADDAEFGRLHAAIRLLLPILPALAASSPVADGVITPWLDYRLQTYRNNSARIPSLTGQVIPERVYTQADYQREILDPIDRDMANRDPTGCLRGPFLNSRGAIARFDRGSIEIRVLDVQECPAADLAIAEFVCRAVELLTRTSPIEYARQQAFEVEPLVAMFGDVIRQGELAVIRDRRWLVSAGITSNRATAGEVWESLLTRIEQEMGPTALSQQAAERIRFLLAHGPLARRILRRLDGDPKEIRNVYRELCQCLVDGRIFGNE